MDYEGLLSLVEERRSCRRFKPDPIPDELVHQIIEVARWAPSGANSQPWDFIVVKEKELRQKIVQFYKDFLSLYYKKEFIVKLRTGRTYSEMGTKRSGRGVRGGFDTP